ncbi:MAG: 3',5'-cyclic-nucleotide phosphodiesterase [Nitrospirae bacterium]|nr:3',5'-cyclic-nucleotide phosphodiesterase [Nitrospirota bacterium]
MRLRVLGCYGGELLGHQSTAFLINGHLLIDAGSVNSLGGVDEISKIRHVVLSHIHLDHIKALPFIAELLAEGGRGVEVFGTEETIGFLKQHIFNGSVWPDLSRLPTPENPAVRYSTMREGGTVIVNGLLVKAIPVNHTVPTTGFLISDSLASMLYSGDTGTTDRIWSEANNAQNLRALMVEVSYPNRLKDRAVITKHLTPHLLTEELKKAGLKRETWIGVYHLKPPFVDEIRKEICGLRMDNLILLEDGDTFET